MRATVKCIKDAVGAEIHIRRGMPDHARLPHEGLEVSEETSELSYLTLPPAVGMIKILILNVVI
jgi:hypothetical protein